MALILVHDTVIVLPEIEYVPFAVVSIEEYPLVLYFFIVILEPLPNIKSTYIVDAEPVTVDVISPLYVLPEIDEGVEPLPEPPELLSEELAFEQHINIPK